MGLVAEVVLNRNGSLPGIAQLQTLIDGLGTLALMAALAGMVLGAATWALGHHSANYQQSASGRKGLLVSGAAALVVGAAPTLVNFLFNLGSAAK